MEVRKPREASIQSTATTPRSQSAKKGTLSKSPECSRPRKVGEGATKSPEERKDSPGTMRAGSQSPARKGRSSRVTEERSPGCNSDKRSATTTPTRAILRGSPPPAGDPKSPLAKARGPQTAKRDNARSRGKSSSRDVPEASLSPTGAQGPAPAGDPKSPLAKARGPQTAKRDNARSRGKSSSRDVSVASLSPTGAQGPAPTSFVTAPSKEYGNEKGVSRLSSRTRGATAATSLPRSTEQCPAGGTPTLSTVATELLHSKPRGTEGLESRGRGLSTVSPRGVSSKQGSHDSREPQAALATSRSARGNQKSRDAKPTSTSPRRSVVGKGQVTGGRSSSQDAKPASSTPVRKDREKAKTADIASEKSAHTSPVTASPDDSVLGYPQDQELVALEATPTQASLDKIMTPRSGGQTQLAVGGAADVSEFSFQDRMLRGLQDVQADSVQATKATTPGKPDASKGPSPVLLKSPLTCCDLCACVLVVAVVAGFAMLWRRGSGEPLAHMAESAAHNTSRCEADECVQLNSLLDDSMDRAVDPCQDMHRYVCGGWSRRHPGKSVRHYTKWWAHRTFVEGGEARRSGRLYAGVAGQAALVFDACEDVLRHGNRDIEPIAALLRGAGMTWPHVNEDMDVLGALAFMDEVLDWAVLFDFEPVPRSETTCRRPAGTRSRRRSQTTGDDDDIIVRVKLSRHFLPVRYLVTDMMERGRFDAYVELLFVTLVNRTLKPLPLAEETKFIEKKVVRDLAEVAEDTTSQPLCTTTEGAALWTPWLTADAWKELLVSLFHLDAYYPVYMEITCPELFRAFFASQDTGETYQASSPQRFTTQVISWYALQTSVMFAYAPAIELMFANSTAAAEAHRYACLHLSTSFSGTAYAFLALAKNRFEDAYWETRSIINRVTDSFLGDFVGAHWRSSDARGLRLLSRNRLSISLLRHAADVFGSWATYYPVRSSFLAVWQWASRGRLPEAFLPQRREGFATCCAREDGVSALVSAAGDACCGLFDELVATADWSGLKWVEIDDDTRNGSRPYLVQPVAWNVPFFAPGLTLPVKYGAFGSLLAAVVAANYFETGEVLEYEMLVETLAACLNTTELSSGDDHRSWSVSADVFARSLTLRNATLEPLWKAYLAAREYHSSRDVSSPSSPVDVARARRDDDRLFFVSWCFAVCGELGASELCNVPLRSGGKFASGNFTKAFGCRAGDPMAVPAKCAQL
ncbi:uncharacterized protein [Dermacentor albipictus]|uniref:uncharacterized protein n=1 Tax=Dermacentor albipictus TaxID=60249 RepID=UPI0031FBE5E7